MGDLQRAQVVLAPKPSSKVLEWAESPHSVRAISSSSCVAMYNKGMEEGVGVAVWKEMEAADAVPARTKIKTNKNAIRR